VPPELSTAAALRYPAMAAHQRTCMQRRIERTEEFIRASGQQRFLRTGSVAFDPEIGGRGLELTAEGELQFVDWLRSTYGSVGRLNEAWNQGHAGFFSETGPARQT
jgi:beta-galactosidase